MLTAKLVLFGRIIARSGAVAHSSHAGRGEKLELAHATILSQNQAPVSALDHANISSTKQVTGARRRFANNGLTIVGASCQIG
jgi:hypothetical protein